MRNHALERQIAFDLRRRRWYLNCPGNPSICSQLK